MSCLYQKRVQTISDASRKKKKRTNLTTTSGTDKDNWPFNFRVLYFSDCAYEEGEVAPDTKVLQEAHILIHMHTCKVECLCAQEQSWLAYQVCSKDVDLTGHLIKYPAPPLLTRDPTPQPCRSDRSTDGLESHHAPQKGVKHTCFFLLSHHIPQWNDHNRTAVICFLPEDAGNSCPVSLIAKCGLSLTPCLMSPGG